MSKPEYTRITDRIREDPEMFAEPVIKDLKGKISRGQFKKLWKQKAKNSNVSWAINHITNEMLDLIYDNSGRAIKDDKSEPSFKEQNYKKWNATKLEMAGKTKTSKKEIKTIKVSRNGKTYTRNIIGKWENKTLFALKKTATLKTNSKQYKNYVSNIVKSTGRSRQAVVKKIQRTRKQLKEGGKK
jgi:hypothetical protein